MIEPSIYEGHVRHRRSAPARNEFRYGIYLFHFDLNSLLTGELPGSLVSRFRREDHYGDPSVPLDAVIRRAAAEALGYEPGGPISVLTHVKRAGYVFNPVCFYYLWRCDGKSLEAIVAEVHNTPWNEQHLYVVPAGADHVSCRFAKRFHVSPFMGMEQQYAWSFNTPGPRLVVHMKNIEAGRKIFDATLCLQRRPLSRLSFLSAAVRHPFVTHATIARIYYQALKLWAKRTPFHPHPGKKHAA